MQMKGDEADMDIVELKTADLIPYENNPRNNENAVDGVAKSIQQFGFQVPLVVTEDNVIVAGHTRWLAAQKLGLKKIPCHIAKNLTEKQIKAYRLVDNKVAEASFWDWNKLDEELAAIADFPDEDDFPDLDMADFGFTTTENLQDISHLYDEVDATKESEDLAKDEGNKESKKQEVVCPHCGQSFEIDAS